MINFKDIELEVNSNYSFVGIEKLHSQLIFRLPKGFDQYLFTTYDSKRDLFFMFYRILRHFKKICVQKGYLQSNADIRTQDRDGVIRTSGSVQTISLPDEDTQENIFYSKLDLIDSILNTADELKILSLAYRLGRTEELDYSQLHLFLHRAIYLDNGAAYIDTMTLPQPIVHYQPTDIVGMYCYILVEVKQQLNEAVSGEIAALAEQFKHSYIGAEYGLFYEECSSKIVDILKDTLELINRNTALKDADYWHFYDAIELFLYGELSQADEGEIWGIKNFHSVWESICLTYLAKIVPSEYILHLDIKFLSNDVVALANSKPKVLDLANVFKINGTRLVPDAVILPTWFNNRNRLLKLENVYSLRKDVNKSGSTWDDYGYKTAFYCKFPYNSKEIRLRIAYEGQPPGDNHTFVELAKFYKSQEGQLIIDSQIPSNFYSFWELDFENLNSEFLYVMFQFNHIFYVALKEAIFTPREFQDFLFNKLSVNYSNTNAFQHSLFRMYTEYTDKRHEIVDMFTKFLYSVSSIKIIDIKYIQMQDFFDVNNRSYLQEKSIRKQFVYEYLLQHFLRADNNFNQLKIKSSFWLPSWQNDFNIIKLGDEYLDGYISLENINFANIVNTYLN